MPQMGKLHVRESNGDHYFNFILSNFYRAEILALLCPIIRKISSPIFFIKMPPNTRWRMEMIEELSPMSPMGLPPSSSTRGLGPVHLHVLLFILMITCMGLCMHSESATLLTNETDGLALLAFKDQVTSDPSGALASSWNRTLHVCRWRGVSCSRRHRRVTALNLEGLGLVGSVSPHLANLTFIRRINLGGNGLYGIIPQEMGRLFRLQYLNLTGNSLEGKIPAKLSTCFDLKIMDFSFNKLVGQLPAELGALSQLVALYLGHNNLTGSIPPSFGNLTSLTVLSLERNGLRGGIPSELGQRQPLEQLQIYENDISGKIPSSIYNLSSIKHLDVSVNQVSGNLPSDLGLTLPNLDWLMLGANRFTGPIPKSIINASRLAFLDLTENGFVGPVPVDIGMLQNLTLLTLSDNRLGQNGEARDLAFVSSLTNCSSLEILAMENDDFTDMFPSSIVNLSSISKFLIGGNRIYGNIPPGIENLVNLTMLSMSENFLTGTIPAGIGKLHKLQGLYMNGNKLSGQIPFSIGNMTLLNKLNLAKNVLDGNIPPSLMTCEFLQEVDLSKNNFTGHIHTDVFSLSSLFYFNISHNSLTGPLPMEVGHLRNLQKLDMTSNELSNGIPETLGKCVGLEELYMGRNNFQGAIPTSLKSLRSIKKLDLSGNDFTGYIPEYFEKFPILEYLNLSFNDFEGQVPKEGIFMKLTALELVGNRKLCGGRPTLQLPACRTRRSSGKSPALKVILIPSIVALSLLFLSCILGIVYWRSKSRKKTVSVTTCLEEQWMSISYAELAKATAGFSGSNLIGEGSFGSVYRGVLESSGGVIAVKVLNLLQRGAQKSFIDECEALRNTRHRNLIKIFTTCSSIDFNGNDFVALVFEYMSNGSLEKWLHEDEDVQQQSRSLTLIQRLNIAIDVASALEYLHQHCQTPIVHRDLKPSNVLLDEHMTARVADFGLARFLPEAAGQTSSAGIKGSVGYVAPEYGIGGKASQLGDIYSYGILLLEMFTGKRPTDEMFKDSVNIHMYVKMALPDRVRDILDPKLLLSEEPVAVDNPRSRSDRCYVSVLKVGVSCSGEVPRERLETKRVLAEMLSIRDSYLRAESAEEVQTARAS